CCAYWFKSHDEYAYYHGLIFIRHECSGVVISLITSTSQLCLSYVKYWLHSQCVCRLLFFWRTANVYAAFRYFHYYCRRVFGGPQSYIAGESCQKNFCLFR